MLRFEIELWIAYGRIEQPMSTSRTVQALAAITDEGLFVRLATAILREANPIYSSLVHTGVNAAGKTVESPLDGICIEQGADPPYMIAVHHTITARDDLETRVLWTEILITNEGMPETAARHLVADTDFAVRRRTIR
jgi:hypothetical protein